MNVPIRVRNVAFPWTFDAHGRTAAATDDEHLRELIELVLFTNPGERLNRPDFGSGLGQLVFAPNSAELAATVQFTLQAALQRYLGDLIALHDLTVSADGDTLTIAVSYVVRSTGQVAIAQYTATA